MRVDLGARYGRTTPLRGSNRYLDERTEGVGDPEDAGARKTGAAAADDAEAQRA